MKASSSFFTLVLVGIYLTAAGSGAAEVLPSDERCSAPPFYTAANEAPNILFVIDKSGSMGWAAYSASGYTGTEEGYFVPDGTYQYDTSDSTWKQVEGEPNLYPWGGTVYTGVDANDKCPNEDDDITDHRTQTDSIGNRYTFKGACLNTLFMNRIDVERWAITGGRPRDCGSDVMDIDCDPDLECTGENCVLELNTGSYGYIEVPTSRINGFVQATLELEVKPRMGVLFYDSSINGDEVYIGDYPNGNDGSSVYPFTYLKRFINSKGEGGSTGTVKGMGEAFDYFKQANTYGYDNGFQHDAGTWKDPMYRCDSNRANCEAAGWCAGNYVILLSDGQWNNPNCTTSYDPVQPAYYMHTDLGRTFGGHSINVDKVYTIGLFMGGTGVNSMQNVAMFGSFVQSGSATWPGGVSGFPTDTCDVDDCSTNPGSGSSCSDIPSPGYIDWDADLDGLPDTFFSPQNAADLKENLFTIFEDIISETGASASVATVTQNVLGEDVVIRGAFRHNPPDNKYWEGHFESYWPNSECLEAIDQTACEAVQETANGVTVDACNWDAASCSAIRSNGSCGSQNTKTDCESIEEVVETETVPACVWYPGECQSYSFQFSTNEGKFCSDADFAVGRCWDAKGILGVTQEPSQRTIFTYINGIRVDITTANAATLDQHLDSSLNFGTLNCSGFDETQCNENEDCTWNNGACEDAGTGLYDTRQLIRWVRGEWDSSWGYIRQRSGLLGDIVYSAPVIVGQPSLSNLSANLAVDSCVDFEPCFAHDTTNSCNEDTANGCSWNEFENICYGAPCSAWATQESCLANGDHPTCQWNGEACEEKDQNTLCNMTGADECFYLYQACNRYRKKVALVAANDGMLHAFVVGKWDADADSGHGAWIYNPDLDAEIGKELWAYIPSNMLSELSCLAEGNYGKSGGCQHRTMVDLSSMAWDVTLESATGSCSGTPTGDCGDYTTIEDCVTGGCTPACSGTFDCTALATSDCRSEAGGPSGCQQECSGSYDCTNLEQVACSNVAECSWGCAEGTDSCSENANYADCSASSGCDWNCSGNYDCSSLDSDQALCSAAGCSWETVDCAWQNARCEGTLDCAVYNEAECNNHGSRCDSVNAFLGCSNEPGAACSDITSRNSCNRYQGCSWSSATCEGTFDCSEITNRNRCNRSADCSWSGGVCTGGSQSCGGFSEWRCNNYVSTCTWIDSSCEGNLDCTGYSESQCEDWRHRALCDGEYEFACENDTNEGCSNNNNEWRCNNYSEAGCSWSDAECTGDPDCSVYTSRNPCNSGEVNNCNGGAKDCSGLSDTSACADVSGCTGVCEGDCCSDSANTTCENVADCFTYDIGCAQSCSGTGTCSVDSCYTDQDGDPDTDDACTFSCTGSVTCSDIDSRGSCEAVSGCSWNTTTDTGSWRTVVVGGQRGGGDLYFALDVTDPDNPNLLWEHSVLRNMVLLKEGATSGDYTAERSFRDKTLYDTFLKAQPFTWSVPYVGKFSLPADMCFYADSSLLYPWSATPASAADPVCWQEGVGGNYNLSGWYAFIGGGTHIYDRDDLPACADLASQTACSGMPCCNWNSGLGRCEDVSGCDVEEQLFQPYMLALDMATGTNIFQYMWPAVQQAFNAKWPITASAEVDGKTIPNAMTTPLVFDLWSGVNTSAASATCSPLTTSSECENGGCRWDTETGYCYDIQPDFGQDGKVDHIFVGDMTGHFWSVSMDNNPSSSVTSPRMFVDRWQTKKAYTACSGLATESLCTEQGCWWDAGTTACQEGYGRRGGYQPVTATAEAAYDTKRNLRVYFGTGKFENVLGTLNDRNDKGMNSFYNITLPLDRMNPVDDSECTVSVTGLPDMTVNCGSNNTVKLSEGTDSIAIRLRDHTCTECTGSSDGSTGRTADVWITPPQPDTTRAEYVSASCTTGTCDCSDNCFKCVMDLTTDGERVLSQPLVAGEMVFFTTYVPETEVCGSSGQGYVYVVDYMCRSLVNDPFAGSGLNTTKFYDAVPKLSAVRASLGAGMPSRPVLDSKGEHILIQTSDAKIHRIKVELGNKFYYKGWSEE